MQKFYSIAIDGPAGAGKSSLAKRLAAAFNLVYLDTGAIYRTVGLACWRRDVDRKDETAVSALLPELDIQIRYDEQGVQHMVLNGEDVSEDIRLPEISLCASDVSALPACRAYLLDMQRRFAQEYNVILDGRDIGTVVLPNADLKIYLTASSEARAERRLLQLQEKGIEADFGEVLRDIILRDEQDMNRDVAPLRRADDAVLLDTSDMTVQQSFTALRTLVEERLPALAGKA